MPQDIPKLLRQYVIQELPTDNKEWEILMLDTADEIERLQEDRDRWKDLALKLLEANPKNLDGEEEKEIYKYALQEAAGYISTYEPWTDMHPEAAYQYFLHRGAKNNYKSSKIDRVDRA